jgi:hypothetical protein
MTSISLNASGDTYRFDLMFNAAPWGDGCKSRCANATLFLDTDHNPNTGLQLPSPDAAETGTDVTVTIQGIREFKNGEQVPTLRVKVTQYIDDATRVEDGRTAMELDVVRDHEHLISTDSALLLTIDGHQLTAPFGKEVRLVYHPPESKALVSVVRGLGTGAGAPKRVDVLGKKKPKAPKKRKGTENP